MANDKLTVIAYSGDGDAYGIGLSHFMHSCRRDINLLYIVANNQNYGLTTGQTSPTTPLGIKTKSTPEGNPTKPFDPIAMAKAAGCSYSKEVDSSDLKGMQTVFVE